MAATVVIKEITGSEANPTYTTKNTDIKSRYYTADIPDSGSTSYPIPIPTTYGKVNPSFWKTHCLQVTSGPEEYIKNIRYYQNWSSHPSSSSEWDLGYPSGDVVIGISGLTIAQAREQTAGMPSSQYDQAHGAVGTSGARIDLEHTYYTGAVSMYNFNSLANAFMVFSGQAFSGSNKTGLSYCVVTQVWVGSGASHGNKTDKTATWVYDEV